MGRAYYRPIPGSRALRTEPLGLSPTLALVEGLGHGEEARVTHGDEVLGAVQVERTVALPSAAFDRLSKKLDALEQAAYFHLLRLSYGEGRNFCRTGKRDLMARLSLSERRLHRVLDALVRKRAAAPLHRDNRGTMYRVFLPEEILGEPVPVKAAGQGMNPMAQFARAETGPSLGDLMRSLFEARGEVDDPPSLARWLSAALERGWTREAVAELARRCAEGSSEKSLPLAALFGARREAGGTP